MYDYGIHIFRRDMRVIDNHTLIQCSQKSKHVIPVFFLDENQITKHAKNKHYFSENAVQFMCECIEDLQQQCPLYIFYGKPNECLRKIIVHLKKYKLLVTWNDDFSKYSKIRDKEMKDVCTSLNVDVLTLNTDYTLQPFLDKPYKQYGSYHKNAMKISPTKPNKTTISNFDNTLTFSHVFNDNFFKFYTKNNTLAQHGGRKWCLNILKNASKFSNYQNTRDCLSYNTTRISGGLNFGCVSIREVYYAFIGNEGLQKQLYWRDYWLQLLVKIDGADEYKHIDERFDKIQWKKNNKKEWDILLNAKTGFLLVDAGINEMIQTGYMHNRIRMIVGVFWTKYLRINPFDPIYGSQVGYSKYLLDAIGGSQNKLNHQWCSGDLDFPGRQFSVKDTLSGRPMDISNDAIKKFDKECKYIKRWLPEFKDIPNQDIYKWDKNMYERYHIHTPPMFNPTERYKEWIISTKI